tara:strand:- start:4542 stop:4922 length:381 start_codon:yes stop_codon:yes gene_type:complete
MNKKTHAVGAGFAMAIAAYCEARERELPAEEAAGNAIASGGVAAICGSLPDLLEPAVHPNHRQFFHSVVFAAALIEGGRRIYRWQPEENWQRLVRNLTLIAGGAYLVHLAMDASTAKSLPMLGKLP